MRLATEWTRLVPEYRRSSSCDGHYRSFEMDHDYRHYWESVHFAYGWSGRLRTVVISLEHCTIEDLSNLPSWTSLGSKFRFASRPAIFFDCWILCSILAFIWTLTKQIRYECKRYNNSIRTDHKQVTNNPKLLSTDNSNACKRRAYCASASEKLPVKVFNEESSGWKLLFRKSQTCLVVICTDQGHAWVMTFPATNSN